MDICFSPAVEWMMCLLSASELASFLRSLEELSSDAGSMRPPMRVVVRDGEPTLEYRAPIRSTSWEYRFSRHRVGIYISDIRWVETSKTQISHD